MGVGPREILSTYIMYKDMVNKDWVKDAEVEERGRPGLDKHH